LNNNTECIITQHITKSDDPKNHHLQSRRRSAPSILFPISSSTSLGATISDIQSPNPKKTNQQSHFSLSPSPSTLGIGTTLPKSVSFDFSQDEQSDELDAFASFDSLDSFGLSNDSE